MQSLFSGAASALLSPRCAAACTLALLAGCDVPKQDKFVYQGGISPDPTAIIEGTILYTGPKPTCVYEQGRFERVRGKVILTLFEYDNPPPPEGTATSSVNLLALPGDELFSEADCLPPGAVATAADRVTRSVAFTWPRLTLFPREPRAYQIRGFFDYDDDMIPFFSVTRLATAGDIGGGAFNDVQDLSKGYTRIPLPEIEGAPNGAVIRGVTVTLGAPIMTERPAFRLDANRKLAANAVFLPVVNAMLVPDGPATLRSFRALTCASGGTDGTTCGLTLQGFTTDDAAKAAASAVEIDVTNPVSYAFYSDPVDVRTVRVNALDVPRAPDGQVDPHPFLGNGLGVRWYAPMVIMQRQQTPVEVAARIPRVLMIGSVLLDDTGAPTKASYSPATGVPVSMPPVAAIELIENRDDCRVPYFAPGTIDLVAGNRLANCGELPTGYYAVNVLGGLAGGTVIPPPDPSRAETPSVISGGRYSAQSWSVPNELGDDVANPATGDELQVAPENVIPHQSIVGGSFIVHDPTPGQSAMCLATNLRGDCAAELLIREDTRGEGIDSNDCLPVDCCDAVAHLCGVPRCPMVQTPEGDNISASPTTVEENAAGLPVPDCVPFDLPVQCCPVP